MKLLMIGNTEYASLLRSYVEDLGEHVDAFVVNKEYLVNDIMDDIPVIALEDMVEKYRSSDYSLVMGIGYNKLGKVKRKIFQQ